VAQIPVLFGACLDRQLSAQCFEVCRRQCWFVSQQFCQCLVNFSIPFGKAFADRFRDTFDLKIAACQVVNLVAESAQLVGEFMVIDVLREFSRQQQFIVLQSLPTILNGVKRGVKNDAVCMQVRV
jgi:hypothetical protein